MPYAPRSSWSFAHVYCWFITPAAALAFTIGMLVAVLDGGAAQPLYGRVLIAGVAVLLAMLMVALKAWPEGGTVSDEPARRPARVGGRVFGEGLGVAVGRIPTTPARGLRVPRLPDAPTVMVPPVRGPSPVAAEHRVVDHVLITREDLKDATAWMPVVGTSSDAAGPASTTVARGSAAVVARESTVSDAERDAVSDVSAAVEMFTEAEARGRFWGELDGFNRGVMSVQEPDPDDGDAPFGR